MPWVMQMLGFAVMLLGIGIALWVSMWLLIVLFCIGIGAVAWVHLRDFLTRKGILNEKFGVPSQPMESSPILDAEFTRIDDTVSTKSVIEEYKNN